MNLDGVEYYYIRNGQNDIIELLDKNGSQIASYIYDSWGMLISIKDQYGNDITNDEISVGYRNPYRYRGYRYDTETGLYYLQSRYYNPEWGRFINADDSSIVTSSPEALTDKNLFNYCDNNPIVRKDVSGYFWDTVFDVVSLVGSITDVVANPTNPIAWVSLTADVVSLAIPGVTGGGKLVKYSAKMLDNGGDVIKSAKAVYKAADKASDIKKATGSYEIAYKSGKTYVGKGGYKRAITSAKRYSKSDGVISIAWKKAPSNRQAFINEYESMVKFGGPLSAGNRSSYNKIWSPGRYLK
jgi:RHS repeat-associated protein